MEGRQNFFVRFINILYEEEKKGEEKNKRILCLVSFAVPPRLIPSLSLDELQVKQKSFSYFLFRLFNVFFAVVFIVCRFSTFQHFRFDFLLSVFLSLFPLLFCRHICVGHLHVDLGLSRATKTKSFLWLNVSFSFIHSLKNFSLLVVFFLSFFRAVRSVFISRPFPFPAKLKPNEFFRQIKASFHIYKSFIVRMVAAKTDSNGKPRKMTTKRERTEKNSQINKIIFFYLYSNHSILLFSLYISLSSIRVARFPYVFRLGFRLSSQLEINWNGRNEMKRIEFRPKMRKSKKRKVAPYASEWMRKMSEEKRMSWRKKWFRFGAVTFVSFHFVCL